MWLGVVVDDNDVDVLSECFLKEKAEKEEKHLKTEKGLI
jgi:hypothetical protein